MSTTEAPVLKATIIIPLILGLRWMGKTDFISGFSRLCNVLSPPLVGSNFLQIFGDAHSILEQNKVSRPIALISSPLTRLETLQSAMMPKGATWVLPTFP